MTEEIYSEQIVDVPKRPTFLTVLCIITFIWSGYTVLTSLAGIFTSNSFDQEEWQEISIQVSESMDQADSQAQEMMEMAMDAVASTIAAGIENAMLLGIIGFLAAGLSFFGAFQMFKLKKMGYYIYILSKVVGVFIPVIILGLNLITGIMYGVGLLIALVGIILYGINSKHLS
jgi:hypothetical protein